MKNLGQIHGILLKQILGRDGHDTDSDHYTNSNSNFLY